MEMAQKNFPRLDEKYAELREITKSEINLKQIENIRAAGNQYSTGMSDFLASWIFNNELGVKRTNAGNTVVDACETLAKAGMDNTNEIAQNAASSLGMSSTIMIIGLIVASVRWHCRSVCNYKKYHQTDQQDHRSPFGRFRPGQLRIRSGIRFQPATGGRRE